MAPQRMISSWFRLDRHDGDDPGEGRQPPEGEPTPNPDSPPDDPPPEGGDDGEPEGQQDDDGPDGEPEGAQPSKPKTLAELLQLLDPEQRRIINGEVTKARNEAKNLRTRLKTAEAKAGQYDELLDQQKTEQQRAQEKAEQAAQAATERAAKLLTQAVRSEVRVLAAERFADPDDAVESRDWTEFAGEDGAVDAGAITAELDDLLTRKPHWAKAAPEPAKPRAPAPNRAQGSSGNGAEQVSFKTADPEAFRAELAKYRLKARS